MLQTFIITLREGVEAALVIAIAVAYLRKLGRPELLPSVYRGILAGITGSIAVALLLSRLEINEDAYGGWVLLVSAVFVASMVWWMNRAAKGMKGEIESRLQRSSSTGSAGWAVFLFVFLMIFREGVETVLMLAAVRLDTSGVLEATGVALGLLLAVLFGFSFVRGTVRINIRSFFQITTVILMVVVAQLTITGLHELSEAQILPSSTTEMAIVGPIVRNDVFFFVVILALAGFMALLEWRGRKTAPAKNLEGAALRKAAWSAHRERLWVIACCTASALFIMAITAEFLYARSATSLSAAIPVAITGGVARIPVSQVSDGNLHRFSLESDGSTVRVIVIARPDKSLAVAFDACQICGSQGYYQKGPNVICRHCSSAIVIPSIGTRGGCNPVPLASSIEGTDLVIPASALSGGVRYFKTAGGTGS
jgi:FTR1 family protein